MARCVQLDPIDSEVQMRNCYVTAALAGALLLAGCGGPAASSPGVPSLSQGAGQGSPSPGSTGARAAALHAAAQCIRQHGISSYADPVLTASGQVYTDSRSIQDAPASVVNAVRQACAGLAARAGLNPDSEPPAPPQLVEAGVRSAQCMRAHGLPNVQDPTAQTPYTPGHGFGLTPGEVPAGGKASPAFQQAVNACRTLLDAEIRASTLGSLGHDG
jgi:hypothetical protein